MTPSPFATVASAKTEQKLQKGIYAGGYTYPHNHAPIPAAVFKAGIPTLAMFHTVSKNLLILSQVSA